MAYPYVMPLLLGAGIAVIIYILKSNTRYGNQERSYEPSSRQGHREDFLVHSDTQRRRSSTRRTAEMESTCTVCLEDTLLNHRIMLNPCGHIFHRECITMWTGPNQVPTCPNCRRKIVTMTANRV